LTRFHRCRRACLQALWSFILGLVLSTTLLAQERVRTAAAPLPIQSFRQNPEAFFYLGPFQEVLAGSVGVQYTDNVNLSATDKISNLSFSQGLSLDTTWVISHLNRLQFTFGGQIMENFYGNGRSQLTFSIDPNSLIEFKLAISDWEVRLYDQFSYTQNPTTDPTATNTANLNSFTNTIGAAIDKDFSLAVLSFSGDFTYNNQSGSNAQGVTNPATSGDRETFRAGPTVTFRLSPSILYGVNAEATRSTGAHSANVNSLNAGPFINGKLSREFEFDLAGGISLVDTNPAIPPGYYLSAAIRYQINRHWQLLFSGSHDLVFTTGTGLTEQSLFRLGTQLNLTRVITFTLSPFVNFGDIKTTTQGSGTTTGPYTQFGIEAGLTWKPRKRWSTALTYDYIRRESSSTVTTFGTGTASDSYIQNTIALSVRYAF
jgi:opacity protein-like surface antigen